MKCPNCGAPMSGAVCTYCGSSRNQALEGGKEKMSRGKRNLLDIILIALGVLWCLICLACIIELGFWSPLELSAGLLLASPGIVCLLIGFRRKKEKADPKHEEN